MFNDLLLPFVESTLRHAFGNQKALDDQIRFATILILWSYWIKTNIKDMSLVAGFKVQLREALEFF